MPYMRQIYRVANTIHEAQRAHMNLSKIEIDDSVLFLPIFVCSHFGWRISVDFVLKVRQTKRKHTFLMIIVSCLMRSIVISTCGCRIPTHNRSQIYFSPIGRWRMPVAYIHLEYGVWVKGGMPTMYAITEKMLAHILVRSAFCLAHSIVRATTDSTKEQCKHIVAKNFGKRL